MSTNKSNSLFWFRQDLRTQDNPGLYYAAQTSNVLAIYIKDDNTPVEQQAGAASQLWLHHALNSLSESLNQKLNFYTGNPLEILIRLCQDYAINQVAWNRCYEPWAITRDRKIKQQLQENGITVNTYNASLLWEPWTIKKSDGTPYKVFTAFYRKGCLKQEPPRIPYPKPESIELIKDKKNPETVSSLQLQSHLAWEQKLLNQWNMSQTGAEEKLTQFLSSRINQYQDGRDIPSLNATSQLSPYLHFGQISVHTIWHQILKRQPDQNTEHFCSELGWREFAYSQLYFNPDLKQTNLKRKYDHFPWKENDKQLFFWQRGQTGIPMVDAGMRELWQTGYMHNRVRMITASFLVKNLRLHWQNGERWFWDCLVDADMASNAASWQWVAGTGYDAAPYFRIFNPVIQGEKFDPHGTYIKQYLPELQSLPTRFLFAPWTAPQQILEEAGIVLGHHYPHPIVDLKQSRAEALAAFSTLKKTGNE